MNEQAVPLTRGEIPTGRIRQLVKRSDRLRWPWVVAALLTGVLLSISLFAALRRAESNRIALEFRRDAADRVAAFRVALTHGIDSLVALDAFFAATPGIDRAAFRRFVSEHLLEEPGVAYLGWAPRVAAENREDFERQARGETDVLPAIAEALRGFQIFEIDSGAPVPARPRSEYFPVKYAEPPRIGQHTLGFDLASDPVQSEAVERALTTGGVVASRRDVIRPDEPDRFGVLMLNPVSTPADGRKASNAELQGFLIGMFDIQAVLHSGLAALEPRGIDIAIHDFTSLRSESLLHFHVSRLLPGGRAWTIDDILSVESRSSARFSAAETVAVGDRQWLISCRPAAGYITDRRTVAPTFALFGGLLLTSVLAGAFWFVLGREAEARRYGQDLLRTKERLEEEVRQREVVQQRQERILDSLPLNVFLKDQQGRFDFVNAMALEALGRDREAVLGKTDFEFFPEEEARELRQHDLEVLNSAEAVKREETLTLHGRTVYLLSGKTRIEGEDPGEPKLLGFSIDVTRIKEAEEALLRSEQRFRQLVENMSSGVALYEAIDDGSDFVIRDYNPAAERMDGVRRDQVVGRRLTAITPHAEETGLLDLLAKVWQTGVPSRQPAVRQRDPAGNECWRENHAYKLPSGNVVAIYDDVSERKRLESVLLHAQKMEAVGRLAGGVAHDFNNLLQVVTGNVDLLLAGDLPSAEHDRMLSEIQQQAERGRELVKRLLAFSRRETRARTAIDLRDLLHRAETLVHRLLRENIELKTDLGDRPLPVKGDAGQLEQVLMNLVVNASDAMPTGGTLDLRVGSNDDREVWFSVGDSGSGIAEEDLGSIFDPYFTTKPAARGTGLGLAVVDGIVSLHQGRIEVENRPGRGVTFRVVLPRDGSGGKVTTAQPEPVSSFGAASGRVLVVEDQAMVRQTIETMLSTLGYEVTTASDGAEARQLAAAQDFDLLVSDIVLPDTTGVELAKEFHRARPELAVLLVSGYAEDAVRERGAGLRFLQKPFRLGELARQVAAALGDRRRQASEDSPVKA